MGSGYCLLLLMTMASIVQSEQLVSEAESCETLRDVMLTPVNTEVLMTYVDESCSDGDFLREVVFADGSLTNVTGNSSYKGERIHSYAITETNGSRAVALAEEDFIRVLVSPHHPLQITIPTVGTPRSLSMAHNEESATHFVIWDDRNTLSSIIISPGGNNYTFTSTSSELAYLRNPKVVSHSDFFITFAQSRHQIIAAVVDASTGSIITRPSTVQTSLFPITDFVVTSLNDTLLLVTLSKSIKGTVMSASWIVPEDDVESGEIVLVANPLVRGYYIDRTAAELQLRAAEIEEALAIGVSFPSVIDVFVIDFEGEVNHTASLQTGEDIFSFDIVNTESSGLVLARTSSAGITITEGVVDILDSEPPLQPAATNAPVSSHPVHVHSSSSSVLLLTVIAIVASASCCILLMLVAFLAIKNNNRRKLSCEPVLGTLVFEADEIVTPEKELGKSL